MQLQPRPDRQRRRARAWNRSQRLSALRSVHVLSRVLPVWLLLIAAAAAVGAPQAEEYFNSGAQFYISNSIPNALTQVENGLKIYPDDVKLKKLYQLLKQQSQQQSQKQQQRQQQQQQQSQSQKNQQSQSQQQQKSAQNKPQQNQPRQNSQQQPQQQKGHATPAGQMTPQEAKQLLDSQKGDEKLLPASLPQPPSNPQRVIEDW